MAKPRTLQSRITHLLTHWPTDKVRPASVSVQSFLQARLPQSSNPQNPTSTTTTNQQPQQQQPQTPEISESSLNALSSLLEDRYARRYPLSPRLRHPAVNPDHYDNLIREFDEAPSRDWWGKVAKRVRGMFRFT